MSLCSQLYLTDWIDIVGGELNGGYRYIKIYRCPRKCMLVLIVRPQVLLDVKYPHIFAKHVSVFKNRKIRGRNYSRKHDFSLNYNRPVASEVKLRG
jgi:hypothetical protein